MLSPVFASRLRPCYQPRECGIRSKVPGVVMSIATSGAPHGCGPVVMQMEQAGRARAGFGSCLDVPLPHSCCGHNACTCTPSCETPTRASTLRAGQCDPTWNTSWSPCCSIPSMASEWATLNCMLASADAHPMSVCRHLLSLTNVPVQMENLDC